MVIWQFQFIKMVRELKILNDVESLSELESEALKRCSDDLPEVADLASDESELMHRVDETLHLILSDVQEIKNDYSLFKDDPDNMSIKGKFKEHSRRLETHKKLLTQLDSEMNEGFSRLEKQILREAKEEHKVFKQITETLQDVTELHGLITEEVNE